MKRTLIAQGKGGLTIYLPKNWIDGKGLTAGSEVDVEEVGSGLVIGPGVSQKKREKKITITALTESAVRTLITSTYRAGYDRVYVRFTDKNALPILESVIENQLLGFEIVKKEPAEYVIENITEPSADQLENVFNKVLMNIEELFDHARQKKTSSAYEETEQRIIRFDNFCRRVVAKTKPRDFHIRWAFQTALNHGQREIYHLLAYLFKTKTKMPQEGYELLELTKEGFMLLKNAYETKNLKLLEELHKREHEIIYKKGYSALKKDIDDVSIHHILSAMRDFYLAASPLTTLLLDAD